VSPLPTKETDLSSAQLLAEQRRAVRRALGPNIAEYFRTRDELRRTGVAQLVNRPAAWDLSEAARVARVSASAGIINAAADARRLSLAYGASGPAVQLAEQIRAWQKLGEGPSTIAGFAKAAQEAQSVSRAYGESGIGVGLAERVRVRRNLLGEETAASVAGLSRAAAASARMPMVRGASASLVELAEQMRDRHKLITGQNSALLATMSLKRGLLATQPAIPSFATAFNVRASAIGALLGGAGTLGIAAQMRGLRNLITEQNSAILAATSLKRGLLASQLTMPSIAAAFNFRASAIGALLDGVGTLRLQEWLEAATDAPTWEEIYGVALRELRAELSGQPSLGREIRIHLALLVLEALLTTAPALPAATREDIHEAFLLAHAVALSVTGYRCALR
jgi:hypothetical protein